MLHSGRSMLQRAQVGAENMAASPLLNGIHGSLESASRGALVAEVNQGGDMVEAIIRQQDAAVPVEKVWANRGKLLRAEPVAALYEQGRVRHVGSLPALEDEMCDFSLGGLSSGRSPDRVDALVWALSALMLTPEGKPRVREI